MAGPFCDCSFFFSDFFFFLYLRLELIYFRWPLSVCFIFVFHFSTHTYYPSYFLLMYKRHNEYSYDYRGSTSGNKVVLLELCLSLVQHSYLPIV